MTRVVRFHRHGGPDVLRIDEVDLPGPGPGEVQIRVKALGLNRAEALMRAGRYIQTPRLPSGLGLEAAGIVERLGEEVAGFAAGDAVSVVPPVSMERWPAYAELAIFPAELVVRHPAALGWEEAAATWMAYVTAYGALIDIAGLGRGDVVVVTAASSSVGLAALLAAGAPHVVAVAEEDLAERLKAIAGPDGVRVVFDAVGGPLFGPLAASMARGGILIEYGGLSSEPTPFPLFDVLAKSLTFRGYLMHEIVADAGRLAAAKAFILDGLVAGAFRPTIARTFGFDEIVEAHRFLESNEQFGKIVVTV